MVYFIRDIIGWLPSPQEPMENSVDGLECGDADREARGVAVTFLASHEAVVKAAALGCNLMVSHEGIYYSHRDRRDIVLSDPVYLMKKQMLEDSGMAVYRYHDGIHRARPDGITEGLLMALDWKRYEAARTQAASVVELPAVTAPALIGHIKQRLGVGHVRFAGDEAAVCRRVGLLVGYRGAGELVLPLMRDMALDLAVYGEGPEWETPEYIRDAAFQRRGKALVILGHAESEIPGMALLARRLREQFPGVPVHFLKDAPATRII